MDEPQPVGEEAVAALLPPGSSLVPTHNSPPSKPPRSPLRPRPVPVLVSDDTAMAFASLSGIAASLQADKPLPVPHPEEETSSSTTMAITPTLTKRQHALHELLSSERAYASDLALVREVHIPLAQGQQIPHSLPAVSPPNNSGSGSGSGSSSSSRTVSTASDPSTSTTGATVNGLAADAIGASADFGPSPPMTQDDVKLIFGNITEIAVFSDLFCQALEEALGDLLEGGRGDDHVGALFLSIIPELERPYKQYITRHPTALNHLQLLPQTPSLQNYLSYTQAIASSLSHAWDLSSLLIKPVQRLLKYPLLLNAIIEETPDSHPDKDNLKEARRQMEEVARNVNEGRRRAEVVRDVLMAKKKPQTPGMTVSASVNLNKVKSLRVASSTGNGATTVGKNGKDDKTPEEAILVAHLESELHAIELFAQQFAKNIVEWARMTSNVILTLRTWSLSFSKVIGLTPTSGSEAFDAYLTVVEKQLMPLCVDLEAVINERVLKELAHLLMTMTQPLKLLESMNEQEPYHHHLMNMTVSPKNRPPPSLLSASTNYLALRGQLAAELPTYISLLHRGLRIFIYRLAAIQTEFWGKVRDQWAGLWEMLRLEEELNAGGEETVNVWFGRWSEVNEVLISLSIVGDPKVVYAELKTRAKALNANSAAATATAAAAGERRERDREYRGDRELVKPEADAEYYTLHHLQTFAHHRETTPPPANIYPLPHPSPSTISYSPSDIGNGYGSYIVPNSPNSYSTTSYSSGGGDHRRDSHQSSSSHYHPHHSHHSQRPRSRDQTNTRDRDRERERYEREKKKSSVQASNALALLGSLEPPLSPKFKQKGESPTTTTNHRNSGVSGVSGHSGGSGSSSNSAALAAGGGGGGKARRGSADLSSGAGGGGSSSWMSAVGLGSAFGAGGGIVGGITASSLGPGAGGGGGGERKRNRTVVVERKNSEESFVSKTTVRSPVSSSSQQQQYPQYAQYHSYQQQLHSPNSPNSPNRASSSGNNNASTSTGHNGMSRHPAPYPQPHRRRTTGGIEPTPEDLREYGAMLMKEEERRREKEFDGYLSSQQHHQQQQPQSQNQQQQKRPSVGSRSVSAMNPHTNDSTNTHSNEQPQNPHGLPHNHNHGSLPRTKSMPLPYYPLTTSSRPGSSRGNAGSSFSNEKEHAKRGAVVGVGEWSTMAVVATDDYRNHDHELDMFDDGEDSELFYQPQVSYSMGYGQGQGYERGEEGYEYYHNVGVGSVRSARPRERRDATIMNSSAAREAGRSGGGGKSHSRSRQRSVGKEDETSAGKRYSEHSAYSSKSEKRPGDVKTDKGEKAGEKDKEKEKASRKRSGSIKSITSFFTSNRESNHSDTIAGSGTGTPSLSHSSSTFTILTTNATTTTDHTPSPRDSWALKPAKYTCIVTHPCKPPSTGSGTNNSPLSYFSFPFFTLKEGEMYDVLQEAGHPSLHPNLPLIVDEGEDCLLLCRRSTRGSNEGPEGESSVGWALASFLEPCNSNGKEL